MSPESAYSDVQSPLSIQSCVTSPGTSVSPMDTTMSPNDICGDKAFDRSDDIGTESDLNCTDQSFQSLSMRNDFSFDSTRQRYNFEKLDFHWSIIKFLVTIQHQT